MKLYRNVTSQIMRRNGHIKNDDQEIPASDHSCYLGLIVLMRMRMRIGLKNQSKMVKLER